MKPDSKLENNKIDKFKNQFKPIKTVSFKKVKKMDKKHILGIQLLIKSLFHEGELDPGELLQTKTYEEIKHTLLSQVYSMFEPFKDDNLKKSYEDCVTNPYINHLTFKNLKNKLNSLKQFHSQNRELRSGILSEIIVSPQVT